MDASLLSILFFVAAVLYSSVGHAGASGYLAAMALVGMAPAQMKPTALTLNVVVATIATIRFYRAGYFNWRTFWPFAVTSIPCSFIGGALTLPPIYYRPLVGAALLVAAWWMLWKRKGEEVLDAPPVPVVPALGAGAVIGLLSGLTGVGGGIFLSPLLILLSWADLRRTSAVSATFILCNSIAGLGGHLASLKSLPDSVWIWCGVVAVGGFIGSELGARRLNIPILRMLLAAVLVVAGLKMVLA